jgi:hypothetical protein
MMRLQAILTSLMLLFAVGCPADDDDSAGDDDTSDDDAGDDDGSDDDAGDDDTAASAYAGDYGGGFSGDAAGVFDATISDEGTLDLVGESTAQDEVTGTGQVEDDGSADITVDGAGQSGKVVIDFSGDFRTDGSDRFGWGDWTSSDGGVGVWGVWPAAFDLGFTPQEIETGCNHSTKYCQSPAMSTQLCEDMTRCQGGFMAAHSSDCLAVYNGFMQLFVDMDGAEDCPDFSQPLPGWVENDCPEVFNACGVLMP